ncbi:hypothetical protein AX17_004523 [Amanita inopinata Kibby_2008]|nr:hypothetical protein AX17_004523 [Amanita inopinata Kibby_2008]
MTGKPTPKQTNQIQNGSSASTADPKLRKDPDNGEAMGANVIATPDMLKVAEAYRAMKDVLANTTKMLDGIESQAKQLSSLSDSTKLREEIKGLREVINQQIEDQKEQVAKVHKNLENMIKGSLKEKIRERLSSVIPGVVQKEVKERVRKELNRQIPDSFKDQAKRHEELMWKIDIDLTNAEAKRFNANARKTDALRRLIIPTAMSSNMGSAAYSTPSTTDEHLRTPGLLFSPTNPDHHLFSSAFPATLNALLAYSADPNKLEQFLRDYETEIPPRIKSSAEEGQLELQMNEALAIIGMSNYKCAMPPYRPRVRPSNGNARGNPPDVLLSPLLISIE